MATLKVLPFITADGSIQASLEPLDEGPFRLEDGSWDLFSHPSEAVAFRVTVNVDRAALVRTLPEGEDLEVTALVAVLESDESRLRKVVYSGPAVDSAFEVALPRGAMAGRVLLRGSILRSRGGSPTQGYGHRQASQVATADLATFWVDPPTVRLGHGIETRWMDFTASGTLPDGNLFALRLEEAPVILLNSAIPSAYQILNSKGTHGAAARIRDAVFGQIVHQVWTALISQCVNSVSRADDEDEPQALLENLGGWEAQVIKDWAPEYFPQEQDPAEAVSRFIEACRQTSGELLLERTADVIQTRMDTLRGFRGLVKESGRFDSGEVSP